MPFRPEISGTLSRSVANATTAKCMKTHGFKRNGIFDFAVPLKAVSFHALSGFRKASGTAERSAPFRRNAGLSKSGLSACYETVLSGTFRCVPLGKSHSQTPTPPAL